MRSFLKPTLPPAVDPDVAGVKKQLSTDEGMEPEETRTDSTSSEDFDKADAKG